MKKIENECCGCDLSCMGSSCKHYSVIRYYCDYCGEENMLYDYDGAEVCSECILKEYDVVEGSENF